MGDDPDATEAPDILHHIACFPTERICGLPHPDREEVPVLGTDLHAIEHQHTRPPGRRIGDARAVSVIGEDDEVQAGERGRRRDVLGPASAVGADRVQVQRAAHDPRVARSRRQRDPRGRQEGKGRRHDGEDRRRDTNYSPASARRAFALSVRSHVNSGSVRPKCPNAAVFL